MKRLIESFIKNKFLSHTFFLGIILVTLMTGFKSTNAYKYGEKNKKEAVDREEKEFLPVTPFAVVELFTSEGCSSCPPADQLLTSIVNQAKENDLKLFALSFHVDYWDYLGWNCLLYTSPSPRD